MATKDTFPVNIETKRQSLSIVSYNCRGFNSAKSEYINNLLLNYDILFLQEHWLSDNQLSDLNLLNVKFLSHAVCGFDNKEVLLGRPYGGCAILWRSDLRARVESVHINSRRVCCV